MKKGLILATTLAMALGVGVAVGAHQKEVAKAEAYGPSDTTWYLCHEGNSWSKNSAADHFTYSKDVGNNWEFETDNYIQLSKNEKFNIVYSWNDGAGWNTFTPNLMTDQSEETVFTVPSAADYAVAARDIKVKFFFQVYGEGATWTGLYWEEYQEPAPVSVYKYSLNGAAGVEMVAHQGSEVKSAELNFKKGDELTFTKDDVAYAVEPKEEGEYSKLYKSGNKLVFAQAYSGSVYLDTASAVLWGGKFEAGYYLAGLGGQWNPKLAMAATSGPNEEGAYYFGGINFSANTEIKSVAFPNDHSELDWANADAEKVHADEGITYTVVTEGEGAGNLKVTSAGKYGVYYNPTSGWYSLVDEEEHVYTVKVGETSYDLIPSNENEYKLNVPGDKIELVHGTAVAVYKDGNLDQTFTAKEIGNNNLKDSKILATSEGQIYLDMDAKTLFVGGLPLGGYHLLKSDAVITMTHIDDFEGFIQYMAASVTFSAGDTVKFIDTNGGGEEHEYKSPAVVWPIGIVNPAGLGDHFEVVKNELQEVQYIRCIEACSTSIYMKIKSGLDEVYFGSVPEYIEQAIKFASDFEKAMAESCSAPAGLKQSAVETAWAEAAADFAELSEDAQKELKLGDYSSQVEVREFGARYAGIYRQHGAHWDLDDFLIWKIEPNQRYYNYALETANNSTIIIVITIAAVSALAFTTLLVFKKRKQK